MQKHGQMSRNSCNPDSICIRQESWDRIYDEYGPILRRYFVSYLTCPDDVDDLVQSVFAKLVKRKQMPEDPRTYIYVAGRNQLRSYWRKKRRRNKHTIPLMAEHNDVIARASFGIDPFEQLYNEEERQKVEQAMRSLPAALAGALRLRIVHGLSLREAAQKAGCSCDAMKKRQQRAKRSLLEFYRKMSEQDLP